MEVNRQELVMMMCEFWALSNNDVCEAATVRFLERSGFTSREIQNILDVVDSTKQESPMDLNEYQENLQWYTDWKESSVKGKEEQ